MKNLLIGTILMLFSALATQAQNEVNLYKLDITLTKPADSTELRTKTLLKPSKEPVVIAFWLTTCPPCMRELATYSEQYASWKKQTNFRLLAISTDFPTRFPRVRQLTKEKGFPFEVYWDRERAFKEVLPGGLNGLPQVFLFDPSGKLVWQHKGYMPGDELELLAQIKAHQK